ncbi:HEPN family nuclease [Nocardia sp. NPDC057440]|uniref:HEPN family nuclease n=1 Tax=Nocardia sp. NPDC057440 TaxID=3346134 RepID=UPI00366B1148
MNEASSRPPPSGDILGRHTVEGFAIRTRKNLDFMHEAHEAGFDVHIVTHLVNSLVGLVVIPWERTLHDSYRQLALTELEQKKWPVWDHCDSAQPPTTLWELVHNLRHSVAHGRVAFSSDAYTLGEVEFTFTNIPPRNGPRWDGRIQGDALFDFCQRLSKMLEGMVG